MVAGWLGLLPVRDLWLARHAFHRATKPEPQPAAAPVTTKLASKKDVDKLKRRLDSLLAAEKAAQRRLAAAEAPTTSAYVVIDDEAPGRYARRLSGAG